LTVADYQATGGIVGAVQQTAERLYDELDEDDRALARRLFLRLVNVDDEFLVTRRRLSWQDLPGAGERDAGVEALVDRFVAARLLTVEADSVEVSHEALLTAWPRLREWVDADRAGLRTHRQLGAAARMWVEHDRDPASLLRGARLEGAESWASSVDHRQDLNAVEADFLDVSLEQARRDAVSTRRRTRRLQTLLAFVAVLALVSASLTAVAVRARTAATRTRDLALSRQLAIQATRLRATDPSLATQLALAAYRIAPTVDARAAVLDASALPTATRLLGQPGETALALSADGGTFAVSRAIDGTVQLYGLRSEGVPVREGVVPAPAPGTHPFALALTADGALLAVGGTDDAVRLWDVSNRAAPRPLGSPLSGFDSAVQSVAFSPDGRTMAAGGGGDAVLRWDLSTPGLARPLSPLRGVAGTTQTVAFAPDGRTIATGGTDGVLRIWSTEGTTEAPPIVEFPVGDKTVIDSAAFSPDSGLLAVGSKDKTIRVWNVGAGTPSPVGPALTGFGSWVNTVSFSQDGSILAGGSSDNSVRFYGVDGWRSLGPTLTSPSPVTGVRFVPGNGGVLSVGEDGAARLWRWPGPYLSGARDTVFGLSYSGDGRRLAVFPNRGDDRIDIWDTADRRHPVLLGAAQLPEGSGLLDGTGALSRDGRTLAAGTAGGPVQLFDVTDAAHPAPGPALTGLTDLVEQVAFSGDGLLVFAASDDGTVRIWDRTRVREGSIGAIKVGGGLVLGMALSPDGRLLATASVDKRIRLWDVSTPSSPSPLATLEGFDNYAYSVALSPDGKVLAAGSADKTLRLWSVADPAHPRPLGGPLTGPGNYVYSVGFDSGGHVLSAAVTDGSVWQWDVRDPTRPRVLATLTAAGSSQVFIVAPSPAGGTLAGGDDKGVHLWSTDPDAVAREVCDGVGDPITRKEWAQYVPGTPYAPPCR
jgi:WD40 repeat protein